MQSLTELCIDSLVTHPISSIVISDKIPWELYEMYLKEKHIREVSHIPSIVKCLVIIELFHAYYYIPSNQMSIMDCITKKLGIEYGNLGLMWKRIEDRSLKEIDANPTQAIKFIKPYHYIMRRLDVQTYVPV